MTDAGVHIAADIAVTLDSDRPGTLAKALGRVSGAGINLDGYAEMNGVVHISWRPTSPPPASALARPAFARCKSRTSL